MTSDSNPLFFDDLRKVVICRICCVGVGPKHLTVHLNNYHGKTLSSEARKAAAAALPVDQAIDPQDSPSLRKAEEQGYSEHLAVVANGYRCLSGNCLYCCPSLATIKRHVISMHPTSNPKDGPCYKYPAAISTIFSSPNLHYFEVNPPISEPNPDSPIEAKIKAAQSQLDNYYHNRQLALARAPANWNEVDLTLWDRRTRWFEHFAGLNMKGLIALATDSRPTDPSSYRSCLIPAIDEFLKTCHHDGQKNTTHVLRIFRSTERSTLSPKPLRFVDPSSLTDYLTPWKRLILYLLRSYKDASCIRLHLPDTMNLILDQLQHTLTAVKTMTSESTSIDAAQQSKRVTALVVQLSAALIEQPVVQSIWHSPLIYFMGLLGYDIIAGKWRGAFEYRPVLSRMIYLLRIIGLRLALPFEQHHTITDHVETATTYHRKFLTDGSSSAFTELQSLRVYAKVVSKDYYVHPTVLWAPDYASLQYKGSRVVIVDLKKWFREMLRTATELLCRQLVFCDEDYLNTRDPKLFTDDMTWATNGESFVSIRSNDLRDGAWRVLQWARSSSTQDILAPPQSPQLFGPAQATKYLRKAETFRELLLLLTLFTGGMPIRGTEITCLKHSNSWNSMRNFFVINNSVVALAEYNKSQSVTDRPKVIARYLPNSVARLYIAFVADVLPFLDLLKLSSGLCQEPTLYNNLLWGVNDVPWESHHVSHIMGRESTKTLGVRLTIASWRDIAISMDQELLQNESSRLADDKFLAHTLQAGHTREVEEHHYALSVDMIQGTSNRTLQAFRQVCQRWHNLLGFEDSLTTVKPNLRRQRHTTPQSEAEALINDEDILPVAKRVCSTKQHSLLSSEIIDMLANGIWDSMYSIYGPTAAFKSPEQLRATQAIVAQKENVLIVLPTGGGKTLTVMIPTLLQRDQVALVMVPFIALQDEMRGRLTSVGVQSAVWTRDLCARTPVVLITPESVANPDFGTYLHSVTNANRLARVYFDECHLLATEASWREAYGKLDILYNVNVQRVFLTGTLSLSCESFIKSSCQLWPEKTAIIRAKTIRKNISYRVTVVPDQSLLIALEALVLAQQRQQRKSLIFTCSIQDADDVALMLGVRPYTARLSRSERSDIHSAFNSGVTNTAVATPGFGSGVDIDALTMVVHYRSTFGLVELQQQAGRAGRQNQSAVSLLLLSKTCYLYLQRYQDKDIDRLALRDYVTTSICRQEILSSYFDNESSRQCLGLQSTACDLCLKPLLATSTKAQTSNDSGSTMPVASPSFQVPNHTSTAVDRGAHQLTNPPTLGVATHALFNSAAIQLSMSDFTGVSRNPRATAEYTLPSLTTVKDMTTVKEDLPPIDDMNRVSPTPASTMVIYETPVARRSKAYIDSSNMSSSPLTSLRSSPTTTSPQIRQFPDTPETLQSYCSAAIKQLHDTCLYCWLVGTDLRGDHTWSSCSHHDVCWDSYKSLGAAIRRRRSVPRGFHCFCYLPLRPLHRGDGYLGAACAYTDKVLPIVLLASRIVSFRQVLEPIQIGSDFIELDIESQADILMKKMQHSASFLVLYAFCRVIHARTVTINS